MQISRKSVNLKSLLIKHLVALLFTANQSIYEKPHLYL